MKSKNSQRFKPSFITEKLVPVLFVLIFFGLLVVLILIGLSLSGLTPAS